MQYWASDVAGLIETLPPLFDFIKRLSDVGSNSAKNMYGCQKGTPTRLSLFLYRFSISRNLFQRKNTLDVVIENRPTNKPKAEIGLFSIFDVDILHVVAVLFSKSSLLWSAVTIFDSLLTSNIYYFTCLVIFTF